MRRISQTVWCQRTDDNGHKLTCRQRTLPTLPRLKFANLSVSNFAIFGDIQSFSLESTGQSYAGEFGATIKRKAPNFSNAGGYGNTCEFVAPLKRFTTNFSNAGGYGNVGKFFASPKRLIPNFSYAIGNGYTGKT